MEPNSIDRVFWDAAQIADAGERDAFLDRACAGNGEFRRRVEQLLQARSQARSFLESPLAHLSATRIEHLEGDVPDTPLGPYKLLEQIGEGGFGVVFMAEQQEPIRRKVALKVLKAGMDTRDVIARFEAERQALALMDHPHIARILDAGQTSSGRPYFVMELVKGIPITDYCDQASLTVRERLELFLNVCQAVQHAHQKGVIHRDLKPSNVLVTLHDGSPVVKVIDFGIAKALGQPLTDKTLFTGFAQLLGTPLYMSPEQAALSGLDVDTRSDIYALGVLLYELLTGSTPFDGERLKAVGFDEIRRIIREVEPDRPSTHMSTLGQAATVVSANRKSDPKRLCQMLRGDLDWIVMKALEKDRNRRYESAVGLARDIENHLNDGPVLACPPSAGYRVRKFARRNRTRLTAAGLVLIAVLSLVGGVVWVMRDRSARLAAGEQAVKRVLDEADTLQGQARWPEALQASKRAQWLLAASGNEELRQRQRDLRKDLEMVLLLDDIRFPDLAGGLEGGSDDAAMSARIAVAYREYGIDVALLDPEVAGELVRARAIRHELAVGLDHWVKLRSSVRRNGGNGDDALRRRLLAASRVADPDPWRNRLRDALEEGRTEALSKLAATTKISDLPLQSLSLLGWALDFAGAAEQAVAVLKQAVQKYPNDFSINFQLAWSLEHQRRPPTDQVKDEVIRFYTVARALRPGNVPVHQWLGHALCRRGRLDEAIAVYRTAVDLNPDEVLHHYWLAVARLGSGDQAGYRRACAALLSRFVPTNKPDVARSVVWTCVLAKEAVNDPDQVVQMAEAAQRSDPQSSTFANVFGAALYRMGHFGEAVRHFHAAGEASRPVATRTAALSPAYCWFFLAMSHHQLGQDEEARKWLAKAIRQAELETQNPSLAWNRRLTLQLLQREAEDLMRGGKK
jgi:serine/threonine protein kinase/tetratricopeptide (TPR) repeat protein